MGEYVGGGDEDDDDDKYVIHSDEEEDEAGEQFACTICRKPFVNAVETLCGHIFCEACALKQFKKSSRCFNCRKQTNGMNNKVMFLDTNGFLVYRCISCC